MSVYAYDEAIIDKFDSLFKKKITINSIDNLFDFKAFISDDTIKLPLISITRTGWSLLDSKPHAMKFTGRQFSYDKDTNTYVNIQMIPIRITYQLDILTDSRKENDIIFRELIFYLSTHPTLTVKIPYSLDTEHVFNLFLDDEIEDNSDISDFKNRGRYFRQTVAMYTDDAYLWKSESYTPSEFKLLMNIYDTEIDDSKLLESLDLTNQFKDEDDTSE